METSINVEFANSSHLSTENVPKNSPNVNNAEEDRLNQPIISFEALTFLTGVAVTILQVRKKLSL